MFELFPSDFTKGQDSIPINGLIWMGDKSYMKQQIKDKLAAGFSCIKLKIGAINFDKELELLKSIRNEFDAQTIEIRVDANGAFKPYEALEKLKRLSDYKLHSIEQPIQQGQLQEMAQLCAVTPLPIALDEELIGVFSVTNKDLLLQTIKPQYIILKPSLLGGFSPCDEWISEAQKLDINWWATSALEGNIGLLAIAEWASSYDLSLPQGLGTGALYKENYPSSLSLEKDTLRYKIN